MNDNSKIVKEFIEAWSSLDANRLAEYFAESESDHNMPLDPVVGKNNVREFIEGFLTTWTDTEWEITHMLADGNVVIAERIDKTKTTAGDVDLPCVGAQSLCPSNGRALWCSGCNDPGPNGSRYSGNVGGHTVDSLLHHAQHH